MLLNVFASLSAAIWLYLFFARGGFWRVSKHLAPLKSHPITNQRIVAVIPARNEADVIASSLTSLLQQKGVPDLHIVLVNDNSTDRTSAVARTAAEQAGQSQRVTILDGRPLPPGWTGKMWAVAQGVAYAQSLRPDFLLLTDADIFHSPNNVAEILAIAEAKQLDLTSYMVKLATISFAEKALIPAFVFFFFMLYPPVWIQSAKRKTAGAAGGCMLIRPEALRRAGGIEAIRHEVIDDCALAAAIKRNGGRLWLGLTPTTHSIRSYGGFAGVGRMIARTAFNQLHHSSLLLLGTLFGLFLTYLLPPLLLFSGKPLPIALGALAWLLMSAAYLHMVRFYKHSLLWSIALPAIALFYMSATFYSAIRYWRKQGGEWKGRTQDTPHNEI